MPAAALRRTNLRIRGDPYSGNDCSCVLHVRTQVKAGSIFDNIILASSYAEAEKFANDTWGKTKDAEKAAFDKVGRFDVCMYIVARMHGGGGAGRPLVVR